MIKYIKTRSQAQSQSDRHIREGKHSLPHTAPGRPQSETIGLGSSFSGDAKPKKTSMKERARRALVHLGSNAEAAVRESKTKGLIEMVMIEVEL